MIKFKKNVHGFYALYLSGTKWRESATVTNTDLKNLQKYLPCNNGEYTEIDYTEKDKDQLITINKQEHLSQNWVVCRRGTLQVLGSTLSKSKRDCIEKFGFTEHAFDNLDNFCCVCVCVYIKTVQNLTL